MFGPGEETTRPETRRELLSTAAALGATFTAGCLDRARTVLGSEGPERVSVTIKTLPADTDPVATQIARHLAEHLRAAGLAVTIEPMPRNEFRRDILVGNDYEVYVSQFPGHQDPDFLRPLLHSEFDGSRGWQNPFEFTDMATDTYLEDQRRSEDGNRRREITRLQREIATKQPFGIVALPREINATRTDRFTGWGEFSPTNPLGYAALRGKEGANTQRLRLTRTSSGVTRNTNPLTVIYRHRGTVTGLLYDPLGRRYDGDVRPWLAKSWEWESRDGTAVVTVRLRPTLRWHDGSSLTASDVAFTYRFLKDTALGSADVAVPAPRHSGRASLVGNVDERDSQTVELQFPKTAPEVARRALTVPVLPAHVWKDKSTLANGAGGNSGVTEALVWSNRQPVGSGIVQFESRAVGESIVLTRFDDHPLNRDDTSELAGRFGTLGFDRLSVRIVPSDKAAVELLSADEADATAMNVDPNTVSHIGSDDTLRLLTTDTRSFYHVGFNTNRTYLGNPYFRRVVVSLLDKSYITDEILDGYAQPAASPLAGTPWIAADLTWAGEDPEVPFLGEDGTLDESAARRAFREAGFEYNDAGELFYQ